MEQRVLVRRVLPEGRAEVVHVRQSACSGDCHKCAGCGAAQETMVFTVKDPIGVRPGDVVIVSSESAPVLFSAAVLYLLPLVLFIAGYLVGMQWSLGGLVGYALGHRFGLGALVGCLAFVLSIGLAVVYDRTVAAKKKTVYTITGYAIPEKRG